MEQRAFVRLRYLTSSNFEPLILGFGEYWNSKRPHFERGKSVFLSPEVAKMSAPHLATLLSRSQEQKPQCYLARPFLATCVGHAHNVGSY